MFAREVHRSNRTSKLYGDSEARIGSLCEDTQFNFVTKIGAEVANEFSDQSVTSSVKQSCIELNQSRLYNMLQLRSFRRSR